jgi:hypothetical protein
MGNLNSLNSHGPTFERFHNIFLAIINSIIGDRDYVEMV